MKLLQIAHGTTLTPSATTNFDKDKAGGGGATEAHSSPNYDTSHMSSSVCFNIVQLVPLFLNVSFCRCPWIHFICREGVLFPCGGALLLDRKTPENHLCQFIMSPGVRLYSILNLVYFPLWKTPGFAKLAHLIEDIKHAVFACTNTRTTEKTNKAISKLNQIYRQS